MEWAQVLTVFTIIATNLGTIIVLYIQLDRKIDENRKDTSVLIEAIRQDIKDFHGKLERQDAEFRGIMAKQDAEFKSHMMHLHVKG